MSINTIALKSLPDVDLHTQTYKYFHRMYILTCYMNMEPVGIQCGQVVAHTSFQYMHVHNKKNRIMDISRNEAVHSQYIILRIYIASGEQY